MTGTQNDDPWRDRPPESGFPEASLFAEPPHPSRSLLPSVLSIIAITIIVGGVIAIGVVSRQGGTPAAVNALTTTPPSTVSTTTAPTTTPPTTTSASVEPSSARVAVDNKPARLTYEVPTDWAASNDTVDVLGVRFGGAAEYGAHECGGERRVRSSVVGAAAQSKTRKPLDPGPTAAAFAKAFSEKHYPGGAVAASTIESTRVDGKSAVLVTAKITPTACASAAEVTVLAIELDPRRAALLVVTSDIAGGPDTPAVASPETIRAIIDSARRS